MYRLDLESEYGKANPVKFKYISTEKYLILNLISVFLFLKRTDATSVKKQDVGK